MNHRIYMYNPMKVVDGVGCYETINIDLKSDLWVKVQLTID